MTALDLCLPSRLRCQGRPKPVLDAVDPLCNHTEFSPKLLLTFCQPVHDTSKRASSTGIIEERLRHHVFRRHHLSHALNEVPLVDALLRIRTRLYSRDLGRLEHGV